MTRRRIALQIDREWTEAPLAGLAGLRGGVDLRDGVLGAVGAAFVVVRALQGVPANPVVTNVDAAADTLRAVGDEPAWSGEDAHGLP